MKTVLALLLAAVAVTASAAFAADGGGQGKSPAQFCKNELLTLGAANFKALYSPGGSGANAMGKCVSKHARAAAANRTNAAKTCKTEMAMPGDNTEMQVKLIQPIAMTEGLRFAIREGGRTVGAGRVIKILK